MSRIIPYVMVLAALGLVAAMAGIWIEDSGKEASLLLDDARARVSTGDADGAVRLFERALDRSEQQGDDDLYYTILLERAELFQKRRAFDRARQDFNAALELHPEDKNLLVRLAQIEMTRDAYDEVIATADRILEEVPRHSVALTLRGRALLRQADEQLATLGALFDDELADTPAAEAKAIMSRLSALDEDDPRRIALLHRFDQLSTSLESRPAAEIRDELSAISVLIAEARNNLAESFGGNVTPDATYAFIDILTRAGYLQDAVDFGLAAVAQQGARAHTGLLQHLASALDDLQRPVAAAAVMDQAVGDSNSLPVEFLPRWCKILYESERWSALFDMARQMRSRSQNEAGRLRRAQAGFYMGMSQFNRGHFQPAMQTLGSFASSNIDSPEIRQLKAMAFATRARASQQEGDVIAERSALLGSIARDRDLSGAVWERLAELRTERGERWVLVEEDLANALRLQPERYDELFARWEDAGERSLVEQGRDIEVQGRLMRQRNRWLPEVEAGPYEMYMLGRWYQEQGESKGMLEIGEALIADLPDFLPALELLTATYMARGRDRDWAETVVRRIELSGHASEALLNELALVPEEQRTPALLLRVMRADPRRSGLLRLARGLREAGHSEEAYEALFVAGLPTITDEGRLLAGEILVDLEDWSTAIEALDPVTEDSPYYIESLRLRIAAALGLRQAGTVESIIQEILLVEDFTQADILPIADTLLRRGQWRLALLLLEELDSRLDTRGGPVLMRMGVAHMIGRDHAAASHAFDRAEAFRDDGGPEVGRVLLSVSQGNWSALPGRVRELRRTGFRPEPFADCILSALEERMDEALSRLGDLIAEDPNNPILRMALAAIQDLEGLPLTPWPELGSNDLAETGAFLRGSQGRARDPRSALALLMALRWEEWTLWAIAEVRAAGNSAGQLWPDYLQAEGLKRIGRDELARTRFRTLVEEHPEFAPGWERLEEIELERLGAYDHAELLALRVERRKALGRREGEEAEEALALSLVERDLGRLEDSLTHARLARQLDPDLLPAITNLGQLLAAAKEFEEAIDVYGEFFDKATIDQSKPFAVEFTELLERAFAEGDLTRNAWHSELERLATHLPRDPVLVLGLAERDLDVREGPAIGLARALQRLDDFRRATQWVPLEELNPGATGEWFRFHLRTDPKRAEAFIEEELTRSPEHLDLWIFLGQAYEAQGRLADAREQYETITSMIPHPDGLMHLGGLVAIFGTDHSLVETSLRRAALLLGVPVESPELEFVRARSLVNSGPRQIDNGIAKLGSLVEALDEGRSDLDSVEVGRRWATSLVHRGEPTDGDAARERLLACRRELDSPTQRDLLLALANMAKNLR